MLARCDDLKPMFTRVRMRLAIVSILRKIMPCMEASLVSFLKSMVRRELGPLHVRAEVCLVAEDAKEHKSGILLVGMLQSGMCVRACDIGSHGDIL